MIGRDSSQQAVPYEQRNSKKKKCIFMLGHTIQVHHIFTQTKRLRMFGRLEYTISFVSNRNIMC